MEYLIDSADLKAIAKIHDVFPISGVTTNPLILSRCNIDVKSAILGIRDIIGNKGLHVQVIGQTFNEIMSDAEKIVNLGGIDTYVKIPVTEAGIKAIKVLSSKGYKLTATAIFTPQQAVLASAAGADYVAPYINRLDNISTNGVEIAANINDILKQEGKTKVLAASFSTVEQIHMVALKGVTAITIQPDLFTKLLYHPLTESAVKDFAIKGEPFYKFEK